MTPPTPPSPTPNGTRSGTPNGARVVILGGGLTGISTAYHLRRPWRLIEKESRLGGHARTDETRGFLFDKTGHWLHLRDPYTKQLVDELLPGQLTPVARKARIFSQGVLTRYPFQGNLYGLPPHVVSQCLLDYLHAAADARSSEPPANFEDFCHKKFGRGISEHFMVPYNEKLWGVHPREITAEWCSRFVPVPKLDDVVRGAVGDVPPEVGYNISFLYPKQGGIETLTRALAKRVVDSPGNPVHLSSDPERIDLARRTLQLGDETIPFSSLVASIPLPELIQRIVDVPDDIAEAASKLRCTSVRYLNVATRTPPPADFHWIYVPEKKYPFYRVGIYTNAVPSMAPAGHGSLYVELSDRAAPASAAAEQSLVGEVAQALAASHAIARADDILFAEMKELKYAYVVFDQNYYASVGTLTRWLEERRVYPRGRYGSWIYNAMEDSILAGREVAQKLDGEAAA